MSTIVSDILKQLDTLNQSTGIDIFIPSLNRAVKFKNLNLKQQKDILKSSVDETLTKLTFIVNFYSIIQENILDKTIDVNSLYTFDRPSIALALRANGLSSEYVFDENVIDLNDLVTKIPTIPVSHDALSKTVELQNLSVDLEVPHLNIDRDVSLTAVNKLKNIQERDIKTLVGELFIHEIIKFVKNVTFKGAEDDQTISFSGLKIEDKIAIIEKFPSNLTSKILEFIKSYRDFEVKFTTLGEATIEIDGSFFSV
jgi:hypothetical protein